MAQFVNRNKKAVALEYEPGEQAPKVIATGQGKLAERIIDVAREADVPIHKDAKLAESLSILDIGEYIPPELYSIVAEVLVFVDSMDRIQSKMNRK
ncbi:MAG: EscU/YscU/HrcU family type III secretion system export apparatus switch protein [Eubacterium sp.]|nr:EscU/YscU/HrcU family type III secretion system export apparatus switch protein [Eubacterium sp.]